MATDLKLYRRNDKTYTVTFTDSNGAAIDITGYTVWFTVKSDVDDTDANAKIQKVVTSHSDPTNGQTQIDLTNADTDIAEGRYVYDIQLLDTSSDVLTVIVGSFIILNRVTDAVS